MVFVPKSAGLALFSFGLAARRATAVSNCDGLIDAIGVTADIVLEDSFSCTQEINIGDSESVTISGPHVITIDTPFSSSVSSLFVNDGSLTLDGVTVESQGGAGVRAVHNAGDLSLEGCTFTALFGTTDSMLSTGGVVSGRQKKSPREKDPLAVYGVCERKILTALKDPPTTCCTRVRVLV